MRKIALLGAAIVAVTAGQALAGASRFGTTAANVRQDLSGRSILYSQNSSDGYSIISQNFTSGSFGTSYDAAGADDFVVPKGKTWKVTGVDVEGLYFEGTGPARSEVITFYKTGTGHPGAVIGKPQTLSCTDTAGSFACTINPVTLTGGTRGKRYWISVVANCNYSKCGEWGWYQNKTTHKDPGQWENPGGGLGTNCTSWNDTSECFPGSDAVDDFVFDLRGKSN